MRALRVVDDGASLVETASPETTGEALVRITMSGICNTDLELARGYMGFRGTLGHEFVGVIESVAASPIGSLESGGGASTLAVGTRVVGEINAGCGTCALCATGDSRHCPTRTVLGIVGRDGAHADLLRLPPRNLIAVPDGVSDLQAVFVEPLAAALGVLERCPIPAGCRIAIIGDGKLGLLIAMALAPRQPILVGKHPDKLALAPVEGISIDEARRRTSVRSGKLDVVIEASGSADGFALALDLLRPQGTLVLKSTFHGATPVDAARIVVDEISVVGSRCGRFAPALQLLASGSVDLSRLISDVVSLDHAEDAMRDAAKPGVLKILLSR
ncbi:MAG: alcohol dehydrogenase catalytic domain-containing protein [Deltaproteobacteria bacterium]|nr:alcohol dehydrogenase catalytic domain-containing protein [Deltaproteobacteria bacterium]